MSRRKQSLGKQATINCIVTVWECLKPFLPIENGMRIFQSERRERRRNVPRKCIQEPVKLLVSELGECYGEITDISEYGVAVTTMWPLMTGERCMLAFDIDTRTTRKRVNAMGTVVYTKATGACQYRAGIVFIDMDAYSRLLIQDLAVQRFTLGAA